MPQAKVCLSSSSSMESCTACSIFSSLLIVLTHNTKNKKHTNYTLQTRYISQISIADTLVTKACFNCFFPHQTQHKRDGNVHENA